MSAYEVPLDHIGFLVNLGEQFDLWTELFEIPDPRGRVACELIEANRLSVAARYREVATPVTETPKFRTLPVPLDRPIDIARALRWIACYRYQCGDSPGWPDHAAHHYIDAMIHLLAIRLVAMFETSWDYDGPLLTLSASGPTGWVASA